MSPKDSTTTSTTESTAPAPVKVKVVLAKGLETFGSQWGSALHVYTDLFDMYLAKVEQIRATGYTGKIVVRNVTPAQPAQEEKKDSTGKVTQKARPATPEIVTLFDADVMIKNRAIVGQCRKLLATCSDPRIGHTKAEKVTKVEATEIEVKDEEMTL